MGYVANENMGDIGEELVDFQVVVFKLGLEEYAVDILHVQEINRILPITRVPKAESHIEGVVNLRGNIIPIINLHKRFSLPVIGKEDDRRIIIFKLEDLEVGVLVDVVSEVIHIYEKDIDDSARSYESTIAEHIRGVVKVKDRLLILLDLKKIFE